MNNDLIFGVKYGSEIFIADTESELRSDPLVSEILTYRNFMGSPLTMVEALDRTLMPIFRRDGYRFVTLAEAANR